MLVDSETVIHNYMYVGGIPSAYLLVPSDVLVPEHGAQEAGQFVLGLDEASGRGHHSRGQRTGHSSSGQELGYIWCQTEWHGTISVQLPCQPETSSEQWLKHCYGDIRKSRCRICGHFVFAICCIGMDPK